VCVTQLSQRGTLETHVPAAEWRSAVSTEDNAKSGTDSSDEDRERTKKDAAEVEKRYEPGSRPTVVIEGTDGTVAGTAFASDDDIASYQAHNADEEQS